MKHGKSSLLKFIAGMFFGASKNKNGKEITDFEKYMPWESEVFSGKIEYELDNGKTFEVFRDFKKKNPIIYNENKEDISKEFNIDKTKGNEFFYEQTKIDETLLFTTSLVEQQAIVLDNKVQNVLIQKISNLLSTGEDSISYKKVMEKLNKKLLEEVGTDRSNDRPINIVMENLQELKNKKEELEEYINKKENIETEKVELNKQLNDVVLNIEIIKEIKKVKENEELEKEKIKIKKEIADDYNKNIEKLQKNENVGAGLVSAQTQKPNIINSAIIIVLIFLNILINLIKTNKLIDYSIIIGTVIYLIINLIVFIKNKINKNKIKIEKENKKNRIKKEIEIIKENKNKIEKELIGLNNILNNENKIKYNLIKNKYNGNIFEELFNFNSKEITNELELEEKEYNNIKLKINSLEIEEKNIAERLDKKALYEEKMLNLEEEKIELLDLERNINIVKELLEIAYSKMKEQITPKFTKDLSHLVEEISGGRYKKVNFNDEFGLTVELENGKYANANLLSLGTIDQLYLSLRLSTIKEITDEKIPIVLDESFVYYDKERLKNILKYLNEKYKDFQIIILSCSNREKEVMDELGILYKLIEL